MKGREEGGDGDLFRNDELGSDLIVSSKSDAFFNYPCRLLWFV